MHAFGLDPNTPINTISMDARNLVDELLKNEDSAGCYDFIYEDALNDYSVPYQLTTKEFNDKLAILLGDNGVYMVELIDVFDDSLFLGSFVSTLEKTFPYVYVITKANQPKSTRNTFVVVGAMKQINLDNLEQDYKRKHLDLWLFDESDIESTKQKANYFVLTDDHAPVEIFMAPVVRKNAQEFLANKLLENANELKKQGEFDKAIAKHKMILKIAPLRSARTYNDIIMILIVQGKIQEAVETFREALDFNEKSYFKSNMAPIHFNLGMALKKSGKIEQALARFDSAIAGYRQLLEKNPKSIQSLVWLGDALVERARFAEAAFYFQKAVALDPTIRDNHIKTIRAMAYAGQIDSAIKITEKSIQFFSRRNRKQTAEQLKKLLEMLQFSKLQPQQQKKPNYTKYE